MEMKISITLETIFYLVNSSNFECRNSKEREIWVLFIPEASHIARAQNRLDLIFKKRRLKSAY